MSIPDYFQEINRFGSPNGHPKQADPSFVRACFIAEGLTEIDPTTGDLIWNAAGRAVINEIISTRFAVAVGLYDFMREIEGKLPNPDVARQLVARGYYAIPSASSGQGLMQAVPSA